MAGYTKLNLKADVEDQAPKFGFSPNLEFRMADAVAKGAEILIGGRPHALGGTWFPLEVAGGAFAAIGRLIPSAWAMNGLQNILIRGLGLESVGLPAVMLLAYAGLFFVLAVWRFRRMDI